MTTIEKWKEKDGRRSSTTPAAFYFSERFMSPLAKVSKLLGAMHVMSKSYPKTHIFPLLTFLVQTHTLLFPFTLKKLQAQVVFFLLCLQATSKPRAKKYVVGLLRSVVSLKCLTQQFLATLPTFFSHARALFMRHIPAASIITFIVLYS